MTVAAPTTPTTAPTTPTSALSRVPAAFRIQFLVRTNLIYVPLMVFGLAVVVGAGIFVWIHHMIRDDATEPMYAGSAQAALWVLAVMGAYAVTHTFPFSLAMSFSRRTFVLGAYLAFAAASAGYAVLFVLMVWFERATDGYWVNGYQFALPFLMDRGGYLGTGLLALMAPLTMMLLAFLLATAFRRLGTMMFWVAVLTVAIVIALSILLTIQYAGFGAILDWFAGQTTWSVTGWLLLPAVASALGAYALLRKATATS